MLSGFGLTGRGSVAGEGDRDAERPALLSLGEAVEEALFEELAAQAEARGLCWSRHGGKVWFEHDDELQIDYRRLARVALEASGGAENDE